MSLKRGNFVKLIFFSAAYIKVGHVIYHFKEPFNKVLMQNKLIHKNYSATILRNVFFGKIGLPIEGNILSSTSF